LLFHDVGKWRDDDHALESVRMAEHVLERLQVSDQQREAVLFLIRHHLRMSLAAFRPTPRIRHRQAVRRAGRDRGAAEVLCLMTLVDIEGGQPENVDAVEGRTVVAAVLDTYNHLTQRYGDELIERNEAGLSELLANRPDDVTEPEITRFLEAAQRYLHVFRARRSIATSGSRAINQAGRVHLSLERKGAIWGLAVATLDKPFLFSNISGVLSSFGMNILRGHAFTNPTDSCSMRSSSRTKSGFSS